jgi:site-specific recombinase XerD
MNAHQAVARMADVIRRKHLALNTEQTYCAWLKRYCQHIALLRAEMPTEQKLEHFLTALSKTHITASTQNQALNAITYNEYPQA